MKARLVSAAVALSLLAGCESMNKETMGTIGGGLLGAAGGAAAGGALSKNKTTGMLIGGTVGALGGALIGKQIGKVLDERDRKKHAEAVAKALETGQSQSWNSTDTGASGQVAVKEASVTKVNTPVTTPPVTTPATPTQPAVVEEVGSPAPTPQVVADSRICRTVTQTIRLKDGTTKSEDLTACKGPNGWEAA